MPVIGRLDDQVWKALIEPIARRHEREAQEKREREKQEAAREEEARAEGEKSEAG